MSRSSSTTLRELQPAGPQARQNDGDAAPVVEEDAHLIARAQGGDRQAFGVLVTRYRAGVVNVVYRMCGDILLAEEAAQEAFLRTWLNLRRYQPDKSFRAWLYRIAINAALDELRRGRSTGALSLSSEDETDAQVRTGVVDNPGAALEERERARLVRQAVMDLPEASRAALILREYGGLSYNEIAAALGIPLGTVMSRLNAARSQLRRSLAALMEEA